jgi:RHS repeat-associated protein
LGAIVETYVSGATYSPYGELSQLVLGTNNLTASLTYARDAQTRRVTDVNLSGQSATPQIEDLSYAYDLSGNITRSTNVQGSAGSATETQCFSYDGLRQLTQAWSATDACASNPSTTGNAHVGGPQPYWTTWAFDDAGNRTAQVQHATGTGTDTSTTYQMSDAAHPHALTTASTTGGAASDSSFTYNADGSMKSMTVAGAASTFSYGPDAELATVTTAAGTSTYIPDADGNTLARQDPTGATTLYLPGQEATISADAKSVTVNKYYDLGGVNVATRVNKGNALYLLADQHGSNQVVVDPTTWTATRRYLDPYGNQLGAITGGSWPGDHGFLNKSVNANTSLVDVGAREYDPVTGRFTSVDPVLAPDDPQQANGYAYADNNPITNSDPSGLMFAMDSEGGGGGYTGGGSSGSANAAEHRGGHTSNAPSTTHPQPPPPPHDFGAGARHGAGEALADVVSSIDPHSVISGIDHLIHHFSIGSLFRAAVEGVTHYQEFKGIWDAYQSGDSYLAGEYTGKLIVELGADLITTILGAKAAKLVVDAIRGASAAKAVEVAESAGDTGQYVYRIHGGEARQWGHSWTTENPLEMANPRSQLGLPKVNSGEYVTCAHVCSIEGVVKRDALPLDGNPGGGPELLFPKPELQLQHVWTTHVEPPL